MADDTFAYNVFDEPIERTPSEYIDNQTSPNLTYHNNPGSIRFADSIVYPNNLPSTYPEPTPIVYPNRLPATFPETQAKLYGEYSGKEIIYNSYAGVDITAMINLPCSEKPLILGELQTISYSIHRENVPVRHLGHTSPVGFVKGTRTIAGSLIFTVFDSYAFYRIGQYKDLLAKGVYPLADMLPPFDIVLSFANEYGKFSKMKILGITIVDEGGTMSVDDLITESTYTFMARGIQPLVTYVPEGVEDISVREQVGAFSENWIH